jgi:putative tryptophan/tyrosine transport system substrate-binding protein
MARKRRPADDPVEWLNRARSNLTRAKADIRVPHVYLEDLCFDAQQAAEKAIKAVLLKRGVRFPFIHDLGDLLDPVHKAGGSVPRSVRDADYRFADGKSERLRELAAELVALKVDVIVTAGNSATAPAKDATKTIPIVMMNDTDPVGQGHIDSLARPGGNITGLSSTSFDLADKRLELLKEIVPKLSRVAVLRDLTNQAVELAGREIDPTARALKVQVQWFDLAKVEDFDGQFKAITKWRASGLVIGGGPLMIRNRKRVIEFAAKSKLPAIYGREEFVEDGGLVKYSASVIDLTRRSATYVDKILKGTKPADLPVEQPMKFDLIINLKAAKQIGLTVPPNVLARADRVIR